MAIDLFKEALAAEATTTKDDLRPFVSVPELDDKIARLNELREQMEAIKTEEAMLAGEIKEKGGDVFLRLLKETGQRPQNFILQDQQGGRVLVIVQDKYTKLTTQKEQAILSALPATGKQIIRTEIEFAFNSDILNKHAKAIQTALSKAISSIKEMSDDEKKKLLKSTTKKSISKGTISKLGEFKNAEEVFGLIEPIIQLKNNSAPADEE